MELWSLFLVRIQSYEGDSKEKGERQGEAFGDEALVDSGWGTVASVGHRQSIRTSKSSEHVLQPHTCERVSRDSPVIGHPSEFW